MKREILKPKASNIYDLFKTLIQFLQEERDKALEEIMEDTE